MATGYSLTYVCPSGSLHPQPLLTCALGVPPEGQRLQAHWPGS